MALAVLAGSWLGQTNLQTDLTLSLSGVKILALHQVGIVGQTTGPFVDLPGNIVVLTPIARLANGTVNLPATTTGFFDISMHSSVLESSAVDQMFNQSSVSTAKLVMEGIVADGQVTRGWIGVEPNDLSPELAETFGVKAKDGVIITGVLQNGPAARSGIRPGDVITTVAGKPVGNVSELLSSVAALKPGTASKFSVLRRDEKIDLDVTPGIRPKPRKPEQ